VECTRLLPHLAWPCVRPWRNSAAPRTHSSPIRLNISPVNEGFERSFTPLCIGARDLKDLPEFGDGAIERLTYLRQGPILGDGFVTREA